ncbi:MAG: cytochrome b/b6 domain-containing protein [Gammaproteobacteria bacterium]|nr:cytochrome b/b6 domain-containing protein [Gammaproteobacteria bacterium]
MPGQLAGWVADTEASPSLPAIVSSAYADEDERGKINDVREEFWEELHEFFANFTLLLVLLHIGGVVHASYADKENLVKAMFTGRKRGVEE